MFCLHGHISNESSTKGEMESEDRDRGHTFKKVGGGGGRGVRGGGLSSDSKWERAENTFPL